MREVSTNQLKELRRQRGWSQAELAERAGISRTAVTAIENRRLVPSVMAALALAKALNTTVESLFGETDDAHETAWAWTPPSPPWRYWHAEVSGRALLYPVEDVKASGYLPQDGACDLERLPPPDFPLARRTLVLACCDPAAGLLATLYARETKFRLIVIPRSSQQAIDLLGQGLVHVAGLHLSSPDDADRNDQAVRSKLGTGFRLMRVASWQEGLALGKANPAASVRSAMRSRLRWVGREPGSGARQCMDELLPDQIHFRRIAHDHRAVADAIRSGWADAGVCLRLVCEEAGLKFFSLRDEFFELCFSAEMAGDPRVEALLRVVRSAEYRRLLAELPGYELRHSGEMRSTA